HVERGENGRARAARRRRGVGGRLRRGSRRRRDGAGARRGRGAHATSVRPHLREGGGGGNRLQAPGGRSARPRSDDRGAANDLPRGLKPASDRDRGGTTGRQLRDWGAASPLSPPPSGSGRRTTTGTAASVSPPDQLIDRHSERNSQRTHSFILWSVEMTVPKQSLTMRDTVASGGTATAVADDRQRGDNLLVRRRLSTSEMALY